MITSFTQINSSSCFFEKHLIVVIVITPVVMKWLIRIKCLVAAPALSSFQVSDRIEWKLKKSVARQ